MTVPKSKWGEVTKVKGADQIARVLVSVLACESEVDRDKEHFWAVGLTTANSIKYVEVVTLGLLDQSLVHPREVFRFAIMQGVAKIIVGHNHPGGSTLPSLEDESVTDCLVKAGKLLGVPVLDHLIIGNSETDV